MRKDELGELQLKRLKKMLRYLYENSKFYSTKLREAGLTPEDVKTFEDFEKKVPIVVKDDVRNFRNKTGDVWGKKSFLKWWKI